MYGGEGRRKSEDLVGELFGRRTVDNVLSLKSCVRPSPFDILDEVQERDVNNTKTGIGREPIRVT